MQKIELILIILLINITSGINAQDFEVSPVKMYFTIDPGESQSQVLSITNHSNFKTPFIITFEDFIIDIDGKKQAIKRNSSKSSCTEWITPEKTFFDINPNEQIQVKITMQAPEEDYTTRWAVMYIQTAHVQTAFEVDKGIAAAVNLSGRIAVHIFRYPSTIIEPKMTIKHLQEAKDPEGKERIFTTLVENEGSTITECKVMFIASDLNSGEEIEFEPIFFESYPGYPREVKFILPETMPPGKYSFVALLDYGKTTTIKGTRLKESLIVLPKNKEE